MTEKTEDHDKKNKDGRIKLETAINRLATNSTVFEQITIALPTVAVKTT